MENKDQELFKIKIRKLTARDLPQVVAIQGIITRQKVTAEKIAILKEHIKKEGNMSLVAVADKRVVGFLISELMTNSFGLDQGGWIKNVGVLPQYMGKGIGQSLANQLFDAYRRKGINEIFTASRWDWGDLLSFFKSLGFERSNFINLYKKLDE
ncbi:MAG: GNAT family N-acetyltransferase [Proteobacteria bacterium]|nr:GNAT family N-acetyltransferase [Pseudomonadota bacterium]MCG2741434.1 GNAT family N-acetyltransferase [Syntrophaceae bacterium]